MVLISLIAKNLPLHEVKFCGTERVRLCVTGKTVADLTISSMHTNLKPRENCGKCALRRANVLKLA